MKSICRSVKQKWNFLIAVGATHNEYTQEQYANKHSRRIDEGIPQEDWNVPVDLCCLCYYIILFPLLLYFLVAIAIILSCSSSRSSSVVFVKRQMSLGGYCGATKCCISSLRQKMPRWTAKFSVISWGCTVYQSLGCSTVLYSIRYPRVY